MGQNIRSKSYNDLTAKEAQNGSKVLSIESCNTLILTIQIVLPIYKSLSLHFNVRLGYL